MISMPKKEVFTIEEDEEDDELDDLDDGLQPEERKMYMENLNDDTLGSEYNSTVQSEKLHRSHHHKVRDEGNSILLSDNYYF